MFVRNNQLIIPLLILIGFTGFTTACSYGGSESQTSIAADQIEQASLETQNNGEALDPTSESETVEQNDAAEQNPPSEEQALQENGDSETVQENFTDEQFNEPSTLLTADNANAVVLQAFEVFTGRAYDKRLTAYPYVQQAPSLNPTNNALGYHFYYETLACDGSGEKSESVYEDETGFDGFTFYDTTYANCSVGGEVLNGRAVLSGDTCCGHGYQKEFSNDFSIAFGDGGEINLSGIYKKHDQVSVENFNYEINYSGGALSVMDATTNKSGESLSGSFHMSPPLLGNQTVIVTVTETFENDEETASNLSYSRGAMKIQAEDSEIVIDADNADAATVNVTIQADGESTTRTEPWSNWFHALSFVPTKLGQDIEAPISDGSGNVLNQNSYRNILTEVFNVITGKRLGKQVLALPSYPYSEFPYEEMQGIDGFGAESIQACDNGGSASLRPFRWGYRQETTGWRSEFRDCEKAGSTFHGHFSTRSYGNYDYFSSGLTVSTDNSSSTFQGTLHYKLRANRSDGFFPAYFYHLDHVYFDSTDTNDPFVLSEANFIYRVQGKIPSDDTAAAASYSDVTGSFTLSSKATNQNTIKVMVPDALHFEHPQAAENITMASSEKGVLYIDAGNGNELYLNAITGDSNTFAVFIYQLNQEPIVIVEQWQDWQSLLGFNDDLLD